MSLEMRSWTPSKPRALCLASPKALTAGLEHEGRQLSIPTERIRKLDLVRRPAFRLEHVGRSHQNTDAPGSGGRDVEAVEAVQGFPSVGGGRVCRGAERVEIHRR